MLHDRETEEVCNVIIPETGNTTTGFRAPDSHGSCIKTLQRYTHVCIQCMSASANLYAHSQTCSNQFTLRSLASFLLRTVDGSRNLLITPINGTNHNGRARFFRKMKIKEPRLLAIKSSLSSGYF